MGVFFGKQEKAAGTAAGLTGLFGYLGGALFANVAFGYIVEHLGWDAGFMVLLSACLLAMLFTAFTWKRERDLKHHENNR